MTTTPDFTWKALPWLCAALGLADGHTPFPWQQDLLCRFSNGVIDPSLDIPTGLGKTSVMAIWLVARACGARLPRRLVYVVDRRAVVDQATDVALHLRKLVDSEPDLKRALGLRPDQSLPISTLRGQYVDNREWLDDPAAPAIIVGTVDMVGSRLLFEGYGVSRKMRPYHAGLLGVDTLVVLDEAHLVPPFEHLLRAVETDQALRSSEPRFQQCLPRFGLLTLSATGRTSNANVVALTKRDLEHEILAKRLNARKSLRIKSLNGDMKLEDALAKQAWALTDNGETAVRVIVYSHSREVAQQTKATIEKLATDDKRACPPTVGVDRELLVGGRRVFEREQAKERLRALGFIAGSDVARTRPAFLFATSAGEVGVDLDADHMVCDLVEWERMVQRLGRVNRRGGGDASVVVIVEPQPEPSATERTPIEKRDRGEELDNKERKHVEAYEKKLRAWGNRRKPLDRLPKNGGAFGASPGALRDLKERALTDAELRQILHDATTPEPLRPALTRPLVDAWALTSLEKHPGRPAVEPWLRGWVDDDPQTAVVWRAHLPVRQGGAAPRKSEVEDFFEAAPPHTSETLETDTFRVVKWIGARAANVSVEKAQEQTSTEPRCLRPEDAVAFVLAPDGGVRESLTLAALKMPDDRAAAKKQRDELFGLFDGATLVIDARLGGVLDGLLDEKQGGSPRTADNDAWVGEGAVGFRVRRVQASEAISRDSHWRERFRFAAEVSEEGQATRWLVVEKWRQDAATEEDRSAGHPQLLDEHQAWTEKRARRLAEVLGLDDELANALALAARLHDEGKTAARWQRAFNAPGGGVYAKTEGPINSHLLDGYRHELGSILRAEDDERVRTLSQELRDLVLHLIIAHHGFARPVIGTGGCEYAPPSVLEEKAAEIALRFARLQARWGPWGLAWWEALVRAADQQASRDNDARFPSGGRF